MHRLLVSVPGVLLAVVCAACGDSSSTKQEGCGGGLSSCGAGCVNLQTDSQNCGICGQACSVGQSCQAGVCACAAGFTPCPAGCVDTMSDSSNCGTCDMACAGGQVCSQGTCSSTGCTDGLTQCGASCVDTNKSTLYCGNCFTQCQAGQTCTAGVCTGGTATGGAGGTTATGGATGTTGGVGPTTGGVGPMTGGTGPTTGGVGPTTGGVGGAGGSTGPTGGRTGRGGTTAAGGATGGGAPTGGAGGATGGGAPTGGNSGDTGGSTGTGGGQTANTLVTSASGAFWKTATWTEVTSNATVTVNDSSAAQTWEGFGAAFNEMGWNYLSTKALQDEAIQALFGRDGCNFAWGRIPIGASDYAMDRYTDDEVPSGSTDLNMESFSIDRDREKLIPYVKAAQAVKPDLRFWASPWTPPTWMKTGPYNPNTGPSHSNFDGGVMKSDDATLKAFAQYLIKWVQAFQGEGINVEIVSPQNEPNYQQNYPTCHWETSTFVTFVGKYFGPAITAAGLDIKIMDGTLSNPSGDADIGQSTLRDASAKPYIGSIGVQWGMSDASQVNALKNLAGGIPIWISETKCDGNMNSSGPAPNDFNYANSTWGYIKGAIQNGLTSYNAWNMVLDKNGLGIDDTRKWAQNTLIVADSGKLTLTPAYYVYRHFSQFVDPGAKVVSTSGGDAVAFKNPDGSLVAVVHSTSANNNYVVSIGGKNLQFAMPNGWATIKYTP
ncbi:MAG: glucosylceramidase [Polyangiaceae bacterium]|nr:glucosylceramidase [Polyangiaceae bacterium]